MRSKIKGGTMRRSIWTPTAMIEHIANNSPSNELRQLVSMQVGFYFSSGDPMYLQVAYGIVATYRAPLVMLSTPMTILNLN